MSGKIPTYQSKITRGLIFVAMVNLISTVAILLVIRPILIGSLTDEYLHSLGEFIKDDIRYVLLVRDPITTKNYVDKIIGIPWVYNVRLYDEDELIAETGGRSNYTAPADIFTEQGSVLTEGNQVHLMRLITLGEGRGMMVSNMRLHVTILDEALSTVIDRILYLLLICVGVVSAALYMVAAYFARRTSRVVTLLSDEMEKVNPERGEIRPVSLNTDIKEFNTVQRSFNSLVKRVDEYNEELERRIQSRTQELSTALKQKERAEEYRSSLFMNISHDLKTPLTANIGYLDVALEELCGDTMDRAKLKHAIEGARGRGEMLAEEVDTLLQYSVSADDLSQIVYQPVDIKKLVEGALEETTLRREAARNTLEFTYTGNSQIQTAERLVRHVLNNLLSNAIRYCEDGHIEVRCHVNESLHLTVSDTGPGIPVEERERIFEPHFRSAVNSVIGPKGMGIGLSMAKTWVDHLNGTIALMPANGKTVFIVTIPDAKH